MIGSPKPPINVQDGFFYQLRKDNTIVEVTFLSGRTRVGRIRRFDKYAVVVEVDGREEMVYKHAIASVVSTGSSAPSVAPPAVRTPTA
ncbi:MAG TPA: RNA chaperone Hfq [Thermoanaerobaculia bacterium]|nr:RNA chaperone Hfq [Thermoanaerobaculia bacterium]